MSAASPDHGLVPLFPDPGRSPGPPASLRTREGFGPGLGSAKGLWPLLAALASLVLLWMLLALLQGQSLILPGPWEVGRVLLELLFQPGFWLSLALSSLRVLGAFLLALVPALPLAVAMGKSGVFRRFISPFHALVRSTPVISIILLALLWFPDPGLVSCFVASLMVFPVLLGTLAEGVQQESPSLGEVGHEYLRTPWGRIRFLTLPWLRPYLRGAGKTALGVAWKAAAAAEVLALPRWGIGSLLQEGKSYLDTAMVFALTGTLILMSLFGDLLWSAILWDGWGRIAGRHRIHRLVHRVPAGIDTPDPKPWTGVREACCLLQVKEFSFAWDGSTGPLIENLDLDLSAGQTIGIMGPSGCGKTTLLSLLLHRGVGHGGRVRGTSLAARGLRFFPVFQEHRLFPWLTLGANALLDLGHPDLQAFISLAVTLELRESLDRYPHEVSGGMAQRAALLRSLVQARSWGSGSKKLSKTDGGPAAVPVFLWDEPFQSLDRDLKLRLLPVLGQELTRNGGGALVVSHQQEDLEILGARILKL